MPGELLSGTEVGVGLFSPIEFEASVEDGKVYIMFGVHIGLSGSSAKSGASVKQMTLGLKGIRDKIKSGALSSIDQYKELSDYMNKNNLVSGKGKGLLSGSADFSFVGFAEGYINAEGEYVFLDGGYILGADIKAGYTVPIFAGYIPLFFETQLKNSISAQFNQYVNAEAKQFIPNGRINWTVTFSAGMGVGMKSVANVSGGAKGSLESVWDIDKDTSEYYRLTGTVSPYLKGELAIFEVEPKLTKLVDRVLYEYPEPDGKAEAAETTPAEEAEDVLKSLFDAKSYTMRAVEESVWTGSTAKRNGDMTLVRDASSGADPQLVRLSDGRLMLFYIGQNPSAADANGQQLYYTYFDGSTWSTPQLYRDDGTAMQRPWQSI